MISMKALMSLSQYDMGVLDGIAKVKDMLQENNSCNGKIAIPILFPILQRALPM